MSEQDIRNKIYEVICTDGTGMQHKKRWKIIALDKDSFTVFEDPNNSKRILIPKHRIDEIIEVE